MRRMILGGVLCVLVGCGGASPAAPSQATVAGTWRGTMTNSLGSGPTPATLTLSQSGSAVSGTWNLVGPDGASTGSLSGNAIGALAAMTLTPSVATQCPYTMNTTIAGNRMTGIYASFTCSVVSSGSIDLTRQ